MLQVSAFVFGADKTLLFSFGSSGSDINELLSSMSVTPGPSNPGIALQTIGTMAFDESNGKRSGVPSVTILALTSIPDKDISSGVEEVQNNSDEVKNSHFNIKAEIESLIISLLEKL